MSQNFLELDPHSPAEKNETLAAAASRHAVMKKQFHTCFLSHGHERRHARFHFFSLWVGNTHTHYRLVSRHDTEVAVQAAVDMMIPFWLWGDEDEYARQCHGRCVVDGGHRRKRHPDSDEAPSPLARIHFIFLFTPLITPHLILFFIFLPFHLSFVSFYFLFLYFCFDNVDS